MLVVRLQKEADTPPPPAYGVPGLGLPDPKVVEESGQGLRPETPEGTIGQEAVAREGYRGSFRVLGRYEGWCRTASRVIGPGRMRARHRRVNRRERRAGRAPSRLFFPLSFPLSFSLCHTYLSFVRRDMG